MNVKRKGLCVFALVLASGFSAGQALASPIFDDGIPVGWDCVGNCGTSGPDGVVTAPPTGGTQYGWVSTFEGENNVALDGIGGEGNPTNGSKLTSSTFSAEAGMELSFAFNYITSDGAGFADYAWARLLDAANNEVALLFTARTTPEGSIVPGFEMPDPQATLDPAEATIIAGAPSWSPLGDSSGSCFDDGCGYSDWVMSYFDIATTGEYKLEFGVTNWIDTAFDSGLAFDGLALNGEFIGPQPDPKPDPSPVPAPATLLLFGLGLIGLGVSRQGRSKA